MSKALKSGQAFRLLGFVPLADRIVVNQKRSCDFLTAPTAIQQNERIGPASDPMLLEAVPGIMDERSPLCV